MRPASIGTIFTISFISFQCSAAFPLPSAHFTFTLPPTAASSAITQQHQHRHTTAAASRGINAASTCSSSRYTSALHVKIPNRIMIQYTPAALQHLAAVELPPTYSQPWTMEKTIAISGAFFMGAILFLMGSYVSTQVLHFDTDQAGILTGGAGIGMGWYAFGGGDVMEKEKEFTDRNGGFDAKLVADRPMRLQTVLDDLEHQMDPKFPVVQSNPERSSKKALEYIHKVHGEEYASLLKNKCEETDRPIRFNPFYARTLIDEHSYDAAVDAVMDWMESVDNVRDMDNDNDNDNHIGAHDDNDHGLDRCGGNKPLFALARPPGHHACQRKGMGGCLFNNSAIAAFYALDSGFKNVAILDFDAHHGNGVAHCVEDEERIRYCSIHEGKEGGNAFIEQKVKEDDPRSQDGNDVGPLGNLLNLNLKAGTGWSNGYKDALINGAVPFLLQDQPDLLIVSAGFDALETDWSSGLTLQPGDYGEIGKVLKDRFGNKVSMGLEGGYSFQDHALSEAIMAFCSAWDD